ncbi:TPA: GntR family transcriptional regulator [Escherichia coli]|nr:GntR family transcriptional regulator [Escherichia coli]
MIRIYKASKGQLKHREIFDEIKKKIDNGEWKEGKAIPTERELAEHFLSSGTTIRKAIESLKQRGYLHSVHGQGTFTLPARSRENHLLHSFTDDIKARGGVPAQNILEIGYIPLSDIIRKNLELDIHVHTVFCIKRIRYMGSTPLGIQTSWLALNDGQEITLEELLATGSLYILLEEKLAIKPLEATEIISARLPSPLERQLLELTADDVVLSCTRVTLSVERKPMEYVEMVYPASRYSYKARITKDSFSV